MLFVQLTLFLLLLTAIAATPVDDAALSLITPAPLLKPRQPSGTQTCGYTDGDYSAYNTIPVIILLIASRIPLVCASGYSCSSSFQAWASDFACCNDQSCVSDYHTCYAATETSSCSWASSKCLRWYDFVTASILTCPLTAVNSTGSQSQCAVYMLQTTEYAYYATYSYSCTDQSTSVSILETATNSPRPTVTCIPNGFSAPISSTTCASPAVLLIPFIISNIISFALNILSSRLSVQTRLKFRQDPKHPNAPGVPSADSAQPFYISYKMWQPRLLYVLVDIRPIERM
ncbi:uncharacterized protein PAC_14646 [Phialocephala subalpina]|uniref:Extracellular membrane protein CFEM domain-containing protein n=1 Tax=Phialocephala subalpina TaxID=576137 RepID=A0A1L7XIG6_9HELO|nr:uncharacterized protein PAC_14646 [Phialocephala subalpina]